jgi:outer membrane biosynthesis protein TonB
MIQNGLRILAALALTAFATSSLNAAPGGSSYQQPKVVSMEDPLYPNEMIAQGIHEGSTTIIVELDNAGNMTDWLAISTTKQEFVNAIGAVIKNWKFAPALRDGKPVPSGMQFSFSFHSNGYVSYNGVGLYLSFFNGIFNPIERPLVANISQLDRMPLPLSVTQPLIDSAIPVGSRSGEITLCFFIDQNGNVRMPVLLECKGDIRLAYAAYDAVLKWKFDIPRVNNAPVMVRAQQKFIFNEPEKDTTKAGK